MAEFRGVSGVDQTVTIPAELINPGFARQEMEIPAIAGTGGRAARFEVLGDVVVLGAAGAYTVADAQRFALALLASVGAGVSRSGSCPECESPEVRR